jgi:hypothetical protein
MKKITITGTQDTDAARVGAFAAIINSDEFRRTENYY